MKKGKMFFTIAAGAIILACIIAYLILGPSIDNPSTTNPSTSPSGDSTSETLDGGGGDSASQATDTPITFPQETTEPPIVVESNVTIQQTPKDPNEVIDRSPIILPGHPEYIDMGSDLNPYISAEGKVFRNDKVITIEIYDRFYDVTHKISFGFATGQCNRWLYLNPSVETTLAPDYPFCFKFSEPSKGSILNISDPVDTSVYNDSLSYTINRTLDRRKNAAYVDAQHPGTVWFSQAPISGQTYIDCLVMSIDGDYIATLRLIIDKGDDGTYSIVNIQNRDLTSYNESTVYSDAELEYIWQLANEVNQDPEQTHFHQVHSSPGYSATFAYERTIIDLRDAHSGLYYASFVPKNSSWSKETRKYANQGVPVIAVTARDHLIHIPFTLYFQVIAAPSGNTHGIYQYIGRDYHRLDSWAALKNLGYEGPDLN